MSGFTQGPWRVVFDDGDSAPGIDAPNCSIVIYGAASEDGVGVLGKTLEQRLANAHLIAAAPELLEALQAIDMSAVLIPGTNGSEAAVGRAALDVARAAIAKALGEQP